MLLRLSIGYRNISKCESQRASAKSPFCGWLPLVVRPITALSLPETSNCERCLCRRAPSRSTRSSPWHPSFARPVCGGHSIEEPTRFGSLRSNSETGRGNSSSQSRGVAKRHPHPMSMPTPWVRLESQPSGGSHTHRGDLPFGREQKCKECLPQAGLVRIRRTGA